MLLWPRRVEVRDDHVSDLQLRTLTDPIRKNVDGDMLVVWAFFRSGVFSSSHAVWRLALSNVVPSTCTSMRIVVPGELHAWFDAEDQQPGLGSAARLRGASSSVLQSCGSIRTGLVDEYGLLDAQMMVRLEPHEHRAYNVAWRVSLTLLQRVLLGPLPGEAVPREGRRSVATHQYSRPLRPVRRAR